MYRTRLAILGLTAATVIAVACGGDKGTGPRGSVDLAGNYSLMSLTFGGIPTTAGGTMAMTSTTFSDSIHVTAPIDSVIKLSGTYATSGSNSIVLNVTQPSATTISGTYARNAAGDTLVLNLSFGATLIGSTWHKQ